MNIDKYGLPVQLDRDASDQLQRVGMLAIAYELQGARIKSITDPWRALLNLLQPAPGVYTRFTGATTDDVTGDQLIPTIAYWALIGNLSELGLMWRRLFVAQNIRKQGEPNVHTFPDIMVFRSSPLFFRAHWLLFPVTLFIDAFLVLAVLFNLLQNKGLDDVDDNNLIVTLTVCRARMPTPLAYLACRIYATFRKENYGSLKYNAHPVIGAILWYHRPEWPSYGNPEIALLWAPIINKYIIK